MNAPYYLTLAGVNGGASVGSSGYYWSGTEDLGTIAYGLGVSSSSAVVYDYNKASALSVRCVKN